MSNSIPRAIFLAAILAVRLSAQDHGVQDHGAQDHGVQDHSAQDQGAATHPHDMSNMPGMSMPDTTKAEATNDAGKNGSSDAEDTAAAHAMNSMDHHHMDMGAHMKMTALRDPKSGDEARAAKVAETARQVAEKYTDYRAALNDGFQIFLPNLPQKQYHFTNNRYAIETAFRFNPEHPTSLLYEKQGSGYKLIGVMYTAPKRMTEDDLDQRIPLSIAQWHEHVNFCAPPATSTPDEKKREMWGPQARFGLAGSIATQEACDTAGGTFHPVIFNWMVHLYPLEKTPEAIWSAERQHDHKD
jgi:hypothetical protein